MAHRVVLIPFDLANSAEHLLSTKGGLDEGVFRQQIKEAEDIRDELFRRWGLILEHRQKLLLSAGSAASSDLSRLIFGDANGEPPRQLVRGRMEGVKPLSDRWLAQPAEIKRKALAVQQKVDEAYMRMALGVKGWRKVKAEDIVFADSQQLGGALNKLGDAEDVLYIRGHCSPGSSTLESSDHKAKIEVGQLVKLLDGKLGRDYGGGIKVFACSSSQDLIKNDSFAYQFADQLARAGWVNARVFGYSESLGTYVSDGESAWPAPVPAGNKVASEHGVRAKLVRQDIHLIRSPGGCGM